MGCHGDCAEIGWIKPTGLRPEREDFVGRVFDSVRLLEAEERIAELINGIQPDERTGERRKDIADYVQSLVGKCFSCKVYIFGSVPLMTYLPDGDIDLTVFSDNENSKDTLGDKVYQVHQMIEDDMKNGNAKFHVKDVQLIEAEVKVVKCLVDGIVVDISFHQTSGSRALSFLQEMDHLIDQDHLFKRSIILIKAWCYYESRILGAHHGLISTYALETMIVYIFHVFDNSFSGPLEVLFRFLEFFSNFDWENFCVSIWGPVPILLLPDIAVIPPRMDNGEFFHKKFFLESCSKLIDSLACGQDCQRRCFASKYFNVVDPLCVHNNLGRSVNKGNFHRICSAFFFGATKLSKLLDLPKEEMISELSQFFKNTWKRHINGLNNSSTATMEHLNPSNQVGPSNISMNISEKEQNLADAGPSFYGTSSQILRMIKQNSVDLSRCNGIKMSVHNAKKEDDFSSNSIIKNQNSENLNFSNSNNIVEGDCKSSRESDCTVGKSSILVASSELDCGTKSLASGIMSRQAVTSIEDSTCLKQSSSLQSKVSNGSSHGCQDGTIEPPLMHSQHSCAQEIYRAPPKFGNYEVPINETARTSDNDNIIATKQSLPGNSQQVEIPNSVAVPCQLYPTGPPVPFLEMLQTYNFPTYRSYYDGLYRLLDDETISSDRNADSRGVPDRPEIHVAAPVKPILSNGFPRPIIPLPGLSSYAYPNIAPNMYFRRIFPPIRPVGSILPQGTQLMPTTCVLPEAQIRTYPANPRVVLRDQSPTIRHSWNYSHYGGNLDKGQQNSIYRSPQVFWFANGRTYYEKPSPLVGRSAFNCSQAVESSSSSHVSTYVTQGMDYSQLLAAQASSSGHQRVMVQKNHQLKEDSFPH